MPVNGKTTLLVRGFTTQQDRANTERDIAAAVARIVGPIQIVWNGKPTDRAGVVSEEVPYDKGLDFATAVKNVLGHTCPITLTVTF